MMFSFKLLVVASIIQLAQTQLEYVNVQAGEGGLYFIHPEVPAGVGDGTSSSKLIVFRCRVFLESQYCRLLNHLQLSSLLTTNSESV